MVGLCPGERVIPRRGLRTVTFLLLSNTHILAVVEDLPQPSSPVTSLLEELRDGGEVAADLCNMVNLARR